MENQESISDEEIKRLEEELANLESTESPTPEKKDSHLVFFREIIQAKDSRKFGNLDNNELLTVRNNLKLDLFFQHQNLKTLGDYFREKGEVFSATSLSKQGKLIDNVVTQIKKEQKLKEPTPEKKRFLFGKKKEGDQE
jgi:hypothetical protein